MLYPLGYDLLGLRGHTLIFSFHSMNWKLWFLHPSYIAQKNQSPTAAIVFWQPGLSKNSNIGCSHCSAEIFPAGFFDISQLNYQLLLNGANFSRFLKNFTQCMASFIQNDYQGEGQHVFFHTAFCMKLLYCFWYIT